MVMGGMAREERFKTPLFSTAVKWSRMIRGWQQAPPTLGCKTGELYPAGIAVGGDMFFLLFFFLLKKGSSSS